MGETLRPNDPPKSIGPWTSIVACDVRGTTKKCYSKTVPVQVRLMGCSKIVNCLNIKTNRAIRRSVQCATILSKPHGCDSTEEIT